MKLQNWETAKNCPKCVIMGQMQAERIVFLIRNIPIFQPEKDGRSLTAVQQCAAAPDHHFQEKVHVGTILDLSLHCILIRGTPLLTNEQIPAQAAAVDHT